MGRKLLFVFLWFMSFTGANAQTVLLEEGFEDPGSWTPAQEWLIADLDGDDLDWEIFKIDNTGPINGFAGNFMTSYSFSNDTELPLLPDNLLISPAVQLVAGQVAELTFKVGGLDEKYFEENYSVYVVQESDFDAATNLATLINAQTALLTTKVADVNATLKTLSLSAFDGQEIRVIFRHHNSTDIFAIAIDDVKIVSSGNASINKELAAQFSVFPNPTTDIVNLTNSGNILVSSVEVRDFYGRKVASFEFSSIATTEINISHLQAGMYFLNITTNEGLLTKKIIKK